MLLLITLREKDNNVVAHYPKRCARNLEAQVMMKNIFTYVFLGGLICWTRKAIINGGVPHCQIYHNKFLAFQQPHSFCFFKTTVAHLQKKIFMRH